MRLLSVLAAGAAFFLGRAAAQSTGTIITDPAQIPEDLNGSNFTYPWPVKLYRFTSQRQTVEMAFMDIKPCSYNGKTAVVLHGKNFCGPTWETTIRALGRQGYRVIAPDQVGFCKSTKPDRYQFSLQQLSQNTRGLLNALGVTNVTVIGHSLGSMMATRYALMYPSTVEKLVLTNPVGLEDYKAKGVPYLDIDANYNQEASSSYQSIRGYEQATYYLGQWKPEYDVWVNMLVNIYKGSRAATYALNQAQIVDLVLTQPVAYEFGLLQPPTLLMIGLKDTTAIGKQWSPPDVAARIGNFAELAPFVTSQIPRGELYAFPNEGHSPQISVPDEYHQALVDWLNRP